MKNKLTRKLMLSAFTLLFAVISLGASTYAWFTLSNQAQINAFEAEVKAGEGIEIAITATGTEEQIKAAQWYTGNVPANVVEDAFKANHFEQFDALTTIDSAANFVNLAGTTNDGKGYISFYVHIKAAEAGDISLTQIKLASNKSLTVDGIDKWTSDAVYYLPTGTNGANKGDEVSVGEQVTYKVEDATRIAIFYGNKSEIYEKAENSTENNFAGMTSQYGAYDYYNSKNPNATLTQDAQKNYKAYTTTQIAKTLLTNTEDNNDLVVGKSEKASDVISFQVKIWIEGWDSECLNAIFGQALSVQFKVSLVKQQTPDQTEDPENGEQG